MDRYHVRVEIGDQRAVKLRRPSGYRALELLNWSRRSIRAAEEVKIDTEGDPDALMSQLQTQSAHYSATFGRMIGKLWAGDPLTATGSTPEEYGLAVFLELEDRGWSEEEIHALAEACTELLRRVTTASVPTKQEIKYHLDFGEAPGA